MMKRLFLLLFLPFVLHSAQPLSFQTLMSLEHATPEQLKSALQEWEGKEVRIKGYVYNQDGKWVVSCDPDLPSCCRKHSPCRKIFLEEGVNYPMAYVTGILNTSPNLHMSQATFEPVEADPLLYLLVCVVIGGVALVILCTRFFKKD